MEDVLTIITSKEFKNAQDEQIKTDDTIKRLEIVLKIIQKEHLDRCPYCNNSVDVLVLQNRLKKLDEKSVSLKEIQAEILKKVK